MEPFEDHGQELVRDIGTLWSNANDFFHIHPHYELILFTSPVETKTIICGQKYITEHPMAILVSQFVPHLISVNRENERGWFPRTVFYFGAHIWEQTGFPLQPETFLENGAARLFDISACFSTLRMMDALYGQLREPWQKVQQLGILLGTLWENRGQSTVMMNLTDSYILQVINYINGHLDRKMTIDSLAKVFFISGEKLKVDFKRNTFTNIGDYIQHMRLHRAKELLSTRPDIAIGEVIHACGYESESYFFKMFKKETGKTPLQYQLGR